MSAKQFLINAALYATELIQQVHIFLCVSSRYELCCCLLENSILVFAVHICLPEITMAATPESLVLDGRLAFRDIYRTAKLNERESVLVRGKSQDDFPDIVPHDPWNGTGVLRDCTKQLATGDELSPDQWRSLQVWHAGLSCQLKLKDGQNILFGLNDDNFLNEFNDLRRGGSMKVEGVKYRLFLVYQLPRGTVISNAIGIERDGENHVCLYPIGDDIAISDIENGLASFTIDVLRD